MTREERDNAITILENEKKCVNRANKNDYCNRDCYNCELVKTDTEILTALDMAIKALQEQADNIPVMYYPQVDGITPTVVAQADGEKTCGTCRNEDTYHCAECENKSDYEQSQADGDLISRAELLKALETWDRFGVDDTNSLFRLDNLSLPHYVAYIHYDDVVKCIKGMPSVAIPSAEPYKGMTNGEVIKAMFGDDKVSEFMGYARIMARVGNWFNDGVVAEFDKDWWNSPYEPQESEVKE